MNIRQEVNINPKFIHLSIQQALFFFFLPWILQKVTATCLTHNRGSGGVFFWQSLSALTMAPSATEFCYPTLRSSEIYLRQTNKGPYLNRAPEYQIRNGSGHRSGNAYAIARSPAPTNTIFYLCYFLYTLVQYIAQTMANEPNLEPFSRNVFVASPGFFPLR